MSKCCDQQIAEGLCKSSPNCAVKLKQQMSGKSSSTTSVFGVPVTGSSQAMSGESQCDQSNPATPAGGLVPYEKLQEMCNSLQVDNAYLRETLRETKKELAAAQRDAERYRWLCKSYMRIQLLTKVGGVISFDVFDAAEDLDATIDKEMA